MNTDCLLITDLWRSKCFAWAILLFGLITNNVWGWLSVLDVLVFISNVWMSILWENYSISTRAY
jgi:hypothetical protein